MKVCICIASSLSLILIKLNQDPLSLVQSFIIILAFLVLIMPQLPQLRRKMEYPSSEFGLSFHLHCSSCSTAFN